MAKLESVYQCKSCGGPFFPWKKSQEFCSKNCRNAFMRENAKITCIASGCGKIVLKSEAIIKKFCSEECKAAFAAAAAHWKDRDRTCERCGEAYSPCHKYQKFCSLKCSPGNKKRLEDKVCQNPECGKTFSPEAGSKKYCSRACYLEITKTGTPHRGPGGYMLVYMPEHPFSYTSGQIPQHRVVMEQKIGRYLERHETVHHINGDKSDNRIENLQLHTGKHGKGIIHECFDCGSRNVVAVELS
jgi:hypothetical protein